MGYSKKSYRLARSLQSNLIIRAKEFTRNVDLFDRFNLLLDDEDFDKFLDDFINTVFSEEAQAQFNSEVEKLDKSENVNVQKVYAHLSETVYLDLRLIRQVLYEYDKQKREKGA